VLEVSLLALAGLIAGATGSWSPCGFSMVDTLGRPGQPRLTAAACAAFALGAPVGGVITFGGLAALGALIQGGGSALALAAAVALAAALLDVLGVRVIPQIRRQVPEPWRRVAPLPVAGFGYGVLLGMGFTTYVLSFAVPALAAVSAAVADPAAGVVLGVAFGIGRAIPIVALAPVSDREVGLRAVSLMAERPALLRGARAAGAAPLAAVALVLATGNAGAATMLVRGGSDPSAGPGDTVAWHVPGANGQIRSGGAVQPLGGAHPALGGGHLAVTVPEGIHVTVLASGASRVVPVAGADALAVGPRWLAWRLANPDRIQVLDLADPAATAVTISETASPDSLSRPALDNDLLVYAVATRSGSVIRGHDLATGASRPLRREKRVLLSGPSVLGGRILYVRTSSTSQQLLMGPAQPRRAGDDRRLLKLRSTTRRDRGFQRGHSRQGRLGIDRRRRPLRPSRYRLWSTALGEDVAYVTRLRRSGRGAPQIVSVSR
jgi:hypothetical protein